MVNSVPHWNRTHKDQPFRLPDSEDPVLAAALDHFGGDVANRKLLDLGCGLGEASLFFANRGASVLSIDTSDVAIRTLHSYCKDYRVPNVTPVRISATSVAELGPFDFVFGSMILHHVEPFDGFVLALRAALRPGGKGFFYENSATSSLLMWFREHLVGKLWVPKYGDKEESPLTRGEVKTLAEHFDVEVVYPQLVFFRLIATYLFGGRGERPLRWVDDLLYRVRRFRRYSYRQYVLLS